jgi:hypothetical protein
VAVIAIADTMAWENARRTSDRAWGEVATSSTLIVLFESEPVAEATADTVLNNDLISLAWATGCVVAKVVFCVEVNLVACGAVVRLKTLAATFVKVAEAPAAAVKILFKAICRLRDDTGAVAALTSFLAKWAIVARP